MVKSKCKYYIFRAIFSGCKKCRSTYGYDKHFACGCCAHRKEEEGSYAVVQILFFTYRRGPYTQTHTNTLRLY